MSKCVSASDCSLRAVCLAMSAGCAMHAGQIGPKPGTPFRRGWTNLGSLETFFDEGGLKTRSVSRFARRVGYELADQGDARRYQLT